MSTWQPIDTAPRDGTWGTAMVVVLWLVAVLQGGVLMGRSMERNRRDLHSTPDIP